MSLNSLEGPRDQDGSLEVPKSQSMAVNQDRCIDLHTQKSRWHLSREVPCPCKQQDGAKGPRAIS